MIDLDAIKARLAAATPGPWRHGPETDAKVGNVVDFGPPPTAPFAVLYCADTRDARAQRLHDADLIAHAPTDIAALIAEVEALRSESLTMRQWAEEAAAAENANAQELREARAEVARLRALLGLE